MYKNTTDRLAQEGLHLGQCSNTRSAEESEAAHARDAADP